MRAVARIVEEVQKLPPKDRRTLISLLTKTASRKSTAPRSRPKPGSASGTQGPYAALLRFAGTMRSRNTDVSSDKYKHLAGIYADNHDNL
ncbi:MAG: hypothetical protein HY699_25100 [Deltaproteobacteria bacterium]|nr:hypothetical protein [Deltaproteobacteria bacterium]